MMRAISVISEEVKSRLHEAWSPSIEPLSPSEVRPILIKKIEECKSELYIYGWDPEIDDTEGVRDALEVALANRTPRYFDHEETVVIRTVLKKGDVRGHWLSFQDKSATTAE